MSCYHPVTVFPGKPPGGGFVYDASKSYVGSVPKSISCSSCIGCRLDHSNEWMLRISHEAQSHEDCCIATLTYEDEHLPDGHNVSSEVVSKFVRRLRKKLGVRSIRYFACGEYGDLNHRPHYHIILFGYSFPDRVLDDVSGVGTHLYLSESLSLLWPFGRAVVGLFTPEGAGYVARYTLKKCSSDSAADLERYSAETGEALGTNREFISMSSKPGIGAGWYDQFAGDCFPSDFVIHDGRRYPVPLYYTRKFIAELNAAPSALFSLEELALRTSRAVAARAHPENKTAARLAVREEVQRLRAERLLRDL